MINTSLVRESGFIHESFNKIGGGDSSFTFIYQQPAPHKRPRARRKARSGVANQRRCTVVGGCAQARNHHKLTQGANARRRSHDPLARPRPRRTSHERETAPSTECTKGESSVVLRDTALDIRDTISLSSRTIAQHIQYSYIGRITPTVYGVHRKTTTERI